MRVKIKRNSKTFLFLIFSSILPIIKGMITIAVSQMNSILTESYLILAGFGLFLLTLSVSTDNKKSSEQWSIFGYIFFSAAFFCASYLSFQSDNLIIAQIIALCGTSLLLLTAYSIILIYRRRETV
jgi:hypothetical protein